MILRSHNNVNTIQPARRPATVPGNNAIKVRRYLEQIIKSRSCSRYEWDRPLADINQTSLSVLVIVAMVVVLVVAFMVMIVMYDVATVGRAVDCRTQLAGGFVLVQGIKNCPVSRFET